MAKIIIYILYFLNEESFFASMLFELVSFKLYSYNLFPFSKEINEIFLKEF